MDESSFTFTRTSSFIQKLPENLSKQDSNASVYQPNSRNFQAKTKTSGLLGACYIDLHAHIGTKQSFSETKGWASIKLANICLKNLSNLQ